MWHGINSYNVKDWKSYKINDDGYFKNQEKDLILPCMQ